MMTTSNQEEKVSQSSLISKMTEEDKVFSSLNKEAGAATAAASTTKPTPADALAAPISDVAKMSESEELDKGGSRTGGGRAKVEGYFVSTPKKRKAATPTGFVAAALLVPASFGDEDGEDSGYEAEMEMETNTSSATRGRRYQLRHRRARRNVVFHGIARKKAAFALPPADLDYEETQVQAQMVTIREAQTATTGSAAGIESGYEGDVDTATDIGTDTGADTAADVASVGPAAAYESGFDGDIDTTADPCTDTATDIESGYEGDVDTGTDTEGMDSPCEEDMETPMGTESGYEGDLETGPDTTTDLESGYEDTDTDTDSGPESGYEGDVSSDFTLWPLRA